jgi:O-antigen ligase
MKLELHSVGHVNHSAIYLTMIFSASLGAYLSFRYPGLFLKKIMLILLTFLLYISLIVGQSRAAFGVGTIIGILFSILLARDKNKTIVMIGIFVSVLIIVLFSNTPIAQKQVANQKANDVLAGRSLIWNTTIEAARLYPLFGIGIDNHAVVTKEEIKNSIESRHEVFDDKLYDFHYKHSHSFYLSNIAERGVVGFAVTILFILMWFLHLIKTFYITRLSDQAAYLWSGSAGAWITTFGIGFVNTTFHHEHGILACLFLGLYLSYCKLHAKV